MIRATTIRSQRIARRAQRARQRPSLNLTALMDIFTILVFFLMVNSSQIEVLPSPKDMTLPESVSTDKPAEHVLIMVTREEILVNGRSVMPVSQAADGSGTVIGQLRSELLQLPLMPLVGGQPGDVSRGEVNIMADKDTSFQIIRKVMATATDARFSRIALAVTSTGGGEG